MMIIIIHFFFNSGDKGKSLAIRVALVACSLAATEPFSAKDQLGSLGKVHSRASRIKAGFDLSCRSICVVIMP